jgi:hypothetical protein
MVNALIKEKADTKKKYDDESAEAKFNKNLAEDMYSLFSAWRTQLEDAITKYLTEVDKDAVDDQGNKAPTGKTDAVDNFKKALRDVYDKTVLNTIDAQAEFDHAKQQIENLEAGTYDAAGDAKYQMEKAQRELDNAQAAYKLAYDNLVAEVERISKMPEYLKPLDPHENADTPNS